MEKVLLPVRWETHSVPEIGQHPQDYINENVLADCDILIAIFWSRLGTPTKREKSGSVEEIRRHVEKRKSALLYFLTKPIPSDADLGQVEKVRDFKAEMQTKALR